MLFWRQDGIEASWKSLTPVLKECEQQCTSEQLLHPYPAGTWGPKSIKNTMSKLINAQTIFPFFRTTSP